MKIYNRLAALLSIACIIFWAGCDKSASEEEELTAEEADSVNQVYYENLIKSTDTLAFVQNPDDSVSKGHYAIKAAERLLYILKTDELPLSEKKTNSIRLTLFDPSIPHTVVRIDKTDAGFELTTYIKSQSENTLEKDTKKISETDWKTLNQLLQKSTFWNYDNKAHAEETVQKYRNIVQLCALEVRAADNYKAAYRFTPEGDELNTVCQKIIDLSGINTDFCQLLICPTPN